MLLMAFPAIHTPASCHTPLPAWLQSPLLALNGPGCSLGLGLKLGDKRTLRHARAFLSWKDW